MRNRGTEGGSVRGGRRRREGGVEGVLGEKGKEGGVWRGKRGVGVGVGKWGGGKVGVEEWRGGGVEE
jgi:hypothetical protein